MALVERHYKTNGTGSSPDDGLAGLWNVLVHYISFIPVPPDDHRIVRQVMSLYVPRVAVGEVNVSVLFSANPGTSCQTFTLHLLSASLNKSKSS